MEIFAKIGNYRNIAVVTLNVKEGHDLTGVYGATDAAAARALRILAKIFSSSVIMTRGEEGLSVYDKKTKTVDHIVSPALPVFDVTGAGDTVVAIAGLMLGAGVPLRDAATIANRAAGVVVGMPRTAVLHPRDFKNILLS